MLFSVTSKCSLKIRDSVLNGWRLRFAEVANRMLGCGVMVAHGTLTPLAVVRFYSPLPNINILRDATVVNAAA